MEDELIAVDRKLNVEKVFIKMTLIAVDRELKKRKSVKDEYDTSGYR